MGCSIHGVPGSLVSRRRSPLVLSESPDGSRVWNASLPSWPPICRRVAPLGFRVLPAYWCVRPRDPGFCVRLGPPSSPLDTRPEGILRTLCSPLDSCPNTIRPVATPIRRVSASKITFGFLTTGCHSPAGSPASPPAGATRRCSTRASSSRSVTKQGECPRLTSSDESDNVLTVLRQ